MNPTLHMIIPNTMSILFYGLSYYKKALRFKQVLASLNIKFVSQELMHFRVTAQLFRQTRGHSNKFVLVTSDSILFAIRMYKSVQHLHFLKGQLISKCPFGAFKSTKKPTKFFKDFGLSSKKIKKIRAFYLPLIEGFILTLLH